jgi:hypothetical protein
LASAKIGDALIKIVDDLISYEGACNESQCQMAILSAKVSAYSGHIWAAREATNEEPIDSGIVDTWVEIRDVRRESEDTRHVWIEVRKDGTLRDSSMAMR